MSLCSIRRVAVQDNANNSLLRQQVFARFVALRARAARANTRSSQTRDLVYCTWGFELRSHIRRAA